MPWDSCSGSMCTFLACEGTWGLSTCSCSSYPVGTFFLWILDLSLSIPGGTWGGISMCSLAESRLDLGWSYHRHTYVYIYKCIFMSVSDLPQDAEEADREAEWCCNCGDRIAIWNSTWHIESQLTFSPLEYSWFGFQTPFPMKLTPTETTCIASVPVVLLSWYSGKLPHSSRHCKRRHLRTVTPIRSFQGVTCVFPLWKLERKKQANNFRRH